MTISGGNDEQPCPLDPALFRSWLKVIRSGGQLRRRFPTWGRIPIDRHLPFLCVYRRPPGREDPGTERLLFGKAAYLLAPGAPTCHAQIQQLVQETAAIESLERKAAFVCHHHHHFDNVEIAVY